MAVKTTLEQLEETQAAITEVMTSQEQGGGLSGRIVRARLEALEAREQRLLERYRTEQGTGGLAINTAVPRRDY